MPLENVERHLQATWGEKADLLQCPHCEEVVQIYGFDYLDEPYPDECIWKCDECEKSFAIDVVVSRQYRTATAWK